MRYIDDPQIHEQANRGRVFDTCVEAADEKMYKLSILERERTTLVNPVNRLKANLQAENLNRSLETEAIAELRIMCTSAWTQNGLKERQFKQSLILQSFHPYDKRCVLAAHEEMGVFFTAPICRLIQPRIGGAL